MKRSTICLLLIIYLFTAGSAQKTKVESIQWKIAGSLPPNEDGSLHRGLAGAVVGISNDALVVAGGCNFPDSMPWIGGKKKYYDELYVFRKNNKDSLALFQSLKLPFALAYPVNVSTDQGVVVAGGENGTGISKKVFLIQWDEAAQKIAVNELPDLPLAVTNASGVMYDGQIYVAGGEMTGGVSDQLIFLDLNNPASGWKFLPALPKPLSHAVMIVQSNGRDDCIYLIGGRSKNVNSTSDLYASTLQFNLKSNVWSEVKPLPYPLSAGTGVASGSTSIILFGGDDGTTFSKTEKLIVAINQEKDEEKQRALNNDKIKLQAGHPGFCRQVLLYDTRKDQWKAIGCIPYDSPVTTTAVKWNGEIIIPGGEIRAGVRTAQILSATLLAR